MKSHVRPPVKTDGAIASTRASRGSARLVEPAFVVSRFGDARSLPLKPGDADLVVTSPPYWLKRDYGVANQIGQEPIADEYVSNLVACMEDWKRVLPAWGSVFINLGDTYHRGSLAGAPARLEVAAQKSGWVLRNRIVWVKDAGMPDPAKDRLKNRHEYIFHFVPLVPRHRRHYYYDQLGYAEKYGNGTGPSDVWSIGLRRDVSGHLAPYPVELVDRILTLACPEQVCTCCGQPRRRIVKRTAELDPVRPQAKRALQLAKEGGLTDAHIAAIQATGISDAGKAMRVQTGTVRNSETTKQLAAEAKAILGGYFREFTFAKRRTVDIGPTAVATARSGPESFSTLLWGCARRPHPRGQAAVGIAVIKCPVCLRSRPMRLSCSVGAWTACGPSDSSGAAVLRN